MHHERLIIVFKVYLLWFKIGNMSEIIKYFGKIDKIEKWVLAHMALPTYNY